MLVAITRAVPGSINRCQLTHLARVPIDFVRATAQHDAYERALQSLGCTIHHLPRLDEMPDSVFVEDAAVVLPEVAIAMRPGAESRRAEVDSVAAAVRAGVGIKEPGTLDGGDVLVIGKRIFVGRSARTNDEAIAQLQRIVAPFHYTVTSVEVRECLHLKSAATSVGAFVLCNPRWIDVHLFEDVIEVDPREPHAANALVVNGAALYPAEYPLTRDRLERKGVKVRTVEAAELAKAEGGVTCCSIILEQ